MIDEFSREEIALWPNALFYKIKSSLNESQEKDMFYRLFSEYSSAHE